MTGLDRGWYDQGPRNAGVVGFDSVVGQIWYADGLVHPDNVALAGYIPSTFSDGEICPETIHGKNIPYRVLKWGHSGGS